jgi:Mrp family chromosome partitioning ATPase
MVDGVVLVVRGERTPRHLTREAIARLRFMQAKVLGVVLNAVNPGAPEYAYHYSYYFQDAAGA